MGADVYIDDRGVESITGGDISNMAAGERGTCEGLETTEELAGWKKTNDEDIYGRRKLMKR